MASRNIYIGVAWPYVNDLFHIGNLAGAYLPPDIFARYHRLRGNRVLMVSGSDFHGTPITLRADKEGVAPEEVARRFHELDEQYLEVFGISYDLYTTTHTENHEKVVQEMFLKLLERGYITVQTTEQLYSEESGRFLQDRYVEGECPYCHAPDARGDQCERCGRALDALELINPVSKVDQTPLVKKETENYFLDLTQLQGEIKAWLEGQTEMRDWVKQEALGWIREGLHPRAITRDMDYGVAIPEDRIPGDKKISGIGRKVFYVWFEAVVGYLSAAIEYSKNKEEDYWKEFFYGEKGETYYFVGQDNLVFHTINWPAQLIAYDKEINLPTNVFVNKFLQLEGQKMSKSRGWFIDTSRLAAEYPIDAVRFYLALNMPEQREFNFTWEDFIRTTNGTLVGQIGNLAHRTLTLASRNFGTEWEQDAPTEEVKAKIEEVKEMMAQHLEKGEARAATAALVELASFGNQYVDRNELWRLVKDEPEEGRRVIRDLLRILEELSLLLFPIVPEGSSRLRGQLGLEALRTEEGTDLWAETREPQTLSIAETPEPVFSKLDEERIERERKLLSGE